MGKYDDDPNIGPLYRVGRSLLAVLGIVFYLPAGIIVLCVRLKLFGRILITILMAAIGFFGVGILW